MNEWYRNRYRRCCIDMHITADDPAFMTEFDAETYADMVALSQAQSIVLYSHSHAGLCFFPTKVGKMHPNLQGRDILREAIDACHARDISAAVYFSLVYDTYAYRANPDWRIILVDGTGAGDHARYGVCCPNSEGYRAYVRGLVEELCTNYEFEGIRFDMTFWPTICYCPHCRARFAKEVGGELPEVVNWEDPTWAAFQHKREEWLVEFAAMATATVHKFKPGASVEHQASTYPHNWRFGVTVPLSYQNTFLQGDFYGDAMQGSVARKLFYNLTANRPGAFETSIGVTLNNYTALKSQDLLNCKAHAALADASAFLFIDSIEPTGKLNPAVYERMGRVFSQSKRYEPYLGGELCQDVGIFLSTESKCDFADNGKRVDDPHLSNRIPHVEGVLGVARALIDEHLPFGVITKKSLADLAQHKLVVLPNVLRMDEEEAAAVREYVRNGGCLYASRFTSLIDKEGQRRPDFLLADVFGVHYAGETKENFTYIRPDGEGSEALFDGYTAQYPLGLHCKQIQLEAEPGVQVLGKLTLPYTDPADPVHFASIHNNPPGIATDRPALVVNQFGKGRVIYAAGDLESSDTAHKVFSNLARQLMSSFSIEAEAPKAVELTMFHQPDNRRFIVNVLNFQKDLPNIPVDGIRARVRLDGKTVTCVQLLPDETPQPFEVKDGYVEFGVPRLDTFHMLALEYA
jgi:hypothetical protein